MLFWTIIIGAIITCHASSINYDPKWNSFSYAKKQENCFKGIETTLIEHFTGPGVITEQWFAGQDCMSADSTIRYYIDGDKLPTIEANLNMLHGMGLFGDEPIIKNKSIHQANLEPAWGTKWIGYTAQNGGRYTTIRIPFQSSIRIAFLPQRSNFYWYIVRGVEHYPIKLGDFLLPLTSRLVLQKTNAILKPLEYVSLASSNKDGLLFMVTLATSSTSFYHLEGCFRIVVNGKPVTYLSSGTEDMFLSAYYFNKGLFHTDHAGCTYINYPGSMSAYKFFVDDPVFIHHGFHLVWRSGEQDSNTCAADSGEECLVDNNGVVFCVTDESKAMHGMTDMTNITSYVWMYQW